jgi:Tfp pilus assembly protein PilE
MLVELMIVSVVIGLLVSMATAQLAQVRVAARNTKAKSDLAIFSGTVERFRTTERLGDVVISASQQVAARAYPNFRAPLNNTFSCLNSAGVLSTCLSTAFGLSAAHDTAFQAIFSGTEVVTDANANSYGQRITATPGRGYVYYYLTSDTVLPSGVDQRSVGSEYVLIADLGTAGGPVDGRSRFWVVKNGGGLVPVTDPNLINGGVAGNPVFATSYLPTFIRGRLN